jgi:hypothetical protein
MKRAPPYGFAPMLRTGKTLQCKYLTGIIATIRTVAYIKSSLSNQQREQMPEASAASRVLVV